MPPDPPDEAPSSILTLPCQSLRAAAPQQFWKGLPLGFCVPGVIAGSEDGPCPLKHWHTAGWFFGFFFPRALFACVFQRAQTHLFNLDDLRLTGRITKNMLGLMYLSSKVTSEWGTLPVHHYKRCSRRNAEVEVPEESPFGWLCGDHSSGPFSWKIEVLENSSTGTERVVEKQVLLWDQRALWWRG